MELQLYPGGSPRFHFPEVGLPTGGVLLLFFVLFLVRDFEFRVSKHEDELVLFTV